MKLVYPIKIFKSHLDMAAASDNAAFLHELYFRHRKEYLVKSYGQKAMKPLALAWEWYWGELVVKSLELVRANGKTVRQMTGVSRARQYIDMLKLSLALPTRPQNYYIYELFDQKNRKIARDIIFRHEVKNVLFNMLNNDCEIGKKSPITNKGSFAEKASDAGLPIAPTICVISNNKVKYYDKQTKTDLFVKRLKGKGGKGANLWKYDPEKDSYMRNKSEIPYNLAEIIMKYKQNSESNPVIIQARIQNHPEILGLSGNALSTCRIVTMINEADQPEAISAVYRMAASKNSIVDNFHRGGIASPVDIDSGVLGRATNLGIVAGLGRISHHPISGALIEGRALPYWGEAVKLAIHAHDCFRPRMVIGWDICVTKDGPVIIEGNAQPCVDFIQRTHNAPLGNSRFGELMAYHLSREFGDS